jgi:hypothetical protein
MYTHTHISDSTETVYEFPLLPNNTAVKHFYTNRSGAKCRLDIYRWGTGLAVSRQIRDIGQNVLRSGRIRDIGQNVLQSSFGNWANT